MELIKKLFLAILCIFTMLSAAENREFRATWSITWHQFSGSMSTEQLKARTREIMDKHVDANMNAVLWQIRQGGTVYYPSEIEPWGSYLGYSDPGYDPLAYAVEEAHKRGLELHAWFNTFHCSSTIPGAPAAEHPEWVNRDGNGDPMTSSRSLSPGLKAVRDYTVELVVEIVENYDIDGIHFDYVRWNEYDNTEAGIMFAKQAEEMQLPDGQYPAGMIEHLEQREETRRDMSMAKPTADNRYLYDIEHPWSGGVPDSTDLYPDATPEVAFASWGDWRRGATNVFIKAVHDTVQTLKPWVKVSPAALGRYKAASWNGYYSVFQDAALWFNEGWVDLLTPMHYHWLNGREMRDHLLSDWEPNIGQGIADERPYSVGPPSYRLSKWSQHQDIVEKCREISWIQGFQFFSYGNWRDSPYANESSHTVFAPKAKQPSYHFLNSDVPATPSVDWLKNNDSSYTLTVTPDGSVTDPQWFVIYRSEDDVIDVDNDEIAEIVFSDSAFSKEFFFDGLQLSDRYYYGVSMCSRYWIESPVSVVSNTDILPVIPPRVTGHTPEDGAVEIPNNQIVVLNFNKSMDPSSISEHLSVSPEVDNLTLNWENPHWVREDHLVLNISASWDFETTYTLTLGASTEDQSGMNIDGNGDGTGGDAFSFSFTISGADEEPPVIINTVPEEGDVVVDTDAPVTLEFDELLNEGSLADKFTFYYGGYTIYPDYSVFTTPGHQTYVTVKPHSMLASSSPVTLDIAAGIRDTTGNSMGSASLNFHSDSSYYAEKKMIDNFTGNYSWYRPGYSGSTSGINDTESSSTLTRENYVPGFGSDKRSLRIICVPETEGWFARIYSADLNAVKNIDTSMIMQAYVFGDGSGYQFRIALAESNSASDNLFEVSSWFTVDWHGWKLVEWDLSDPAQYGEWGGMTGGSLDGTAYSVNSIQLQGNPATPLAPVTFYIDQLRSADRREGIPEPNQPPVIEDIPDTSTTSGTAIYIQAAYSDPDTDDNLTFRIVPDTNAFDFRYYSSAPGRVRILPDDTYEGVAEMMAIVTDNGVGELSDTAYFNLTVTPETRIADIPETFHVYPNYPNPFNPVTTVHFDLPSAEQVLIEIYNIRGRKISVLADRRFEAGSYKLQFDAGSLSSGVYFYKIKAGEYVHVDRMTLLK